MPGTFADRLRSGPPVVADGGMGVILAAAVAGLRVPEEANLRAPEAVVSAHVSFINAGAELIETNSPSTTWRTSSRRSTRRRSSWRERRAR
jgi:methionine synthase I (cobalamin-dependent)